jgi:two-component system sensor histidine kinase UhpB
MNNRTTIENSHDAIYTCDSWGFIKTYNKAAAILWGREPDVGKDLWCGSWKIYDKNGRSLSMDKHPMAIALKEGRLVYGDELIVQRPDGSYRRINPYSSPLVDTNGQLTGVVSMLMEISEEDIVERENQEKYKTIFEQASDAIIICSFDGTIYEFNKSCCTYLGYNETEYAKLRLQDILVEDIVMDKDNYAAIMQGEVRTVYRHLKCKNGVILEVEITAKLLEDGKLICFARDLTERKRAEQALKESEIFNKSVLTSITSHIAVVDENGTIISVNKAWSDFALDNRQSLLHRTAVGTNYIDACTQSIAAGQELAVKALEGFYQVLNKELPIFEMEYPCYSPKEQQWFLLRITKFADDSPKVVMMHIDITERVKASAITNETLERYDILAKATSDTIWDWDISNNKMKYNDVIAKMFGYKTSEIKNILEWWKQNIHPEDMPTVSLALGKVFKNKAENLHMEYRFRCENGTYKYIYDRAFVIFDEYGQPVRMIGAMQDISERKITEKKFIAMKKEMMDQKVEEQKKNIRAILNAQEKERRHMGEELHDNINQMLAGTKLYLSIAANGNDQLKEALKYPMELIDDTMNEIRLLTRRSVTPKQNINLKELVQVLLETMFKSTGIKTCFTYNVVNEIHDDDLKLNIYRVIQEQTNNIMKYANPVSVNISIKAYNHAINVTISDDGRGFDVNKKRDGIGIGNIINRVESFNGVIKIISSPGNGCRMLIEVPY